MRNLLVASLFLASMLAGCLDDTPTDEVDIPIDPSTGLPDLKAMGLPLIHSHPAYNFPTNSDLPEGMMLPPAGQNNSHPGLDVWQTVIHPGLPEPLSGMEFGARTSGISGSNGIAVLGNLAFVGPGAGPIHIVDISDPLNPNVLSTVDAPARDIDTILYPDGRLVLASTRGGPQITFTDVTDPWNPFVASTIDTTRSAHNLVVVPGTPIVYTSASDSGANGGIPTVGNPVAPPQGKTDIIDASDPGAPFIEQTWENGYGCHDAAFLMRQDLGKYRGYCAGIDKLQIWDMADPLYPTVLNEWGWPAGGVHDVGAASLVTFAHLAIPNHDGTVLILGDETGGGAAPGCDFSVTTPTGQTVTGPLGNLWFYDISDEMTPLLRGSISPSATDQRGSCTAHFGKVIEDTNHVVMGFYSAGVLMVNFDDLQNPYVVDRYEQPLPVVGEGTGPGTIWDVWYHQGYLLTGDMSNGIDVLTLH